MGEILLIGAGPMAVAYAEVLKAMNKSFIVIGRGTMSANEFSKKTNIIPHLGGLPAYVKKNEVKGAIAIIVTGTETLMPTLLTLIDAGVSQILIEKPAAISIEELLANEVKLAPFANKIFVAYNRRFYASVKEAQRLINEDRGLLSMHFEFTEWAHKIEDLTKAPGVKENWFFANSTHVIDLAFYLAGNPFDWSAYSKEGQIKWHQKTNFVGAGITNKNVLFSYISNWESAGRWAIELLTANKRIYLKPLEGIFIQNKGSLTITEHDFDDSLDKNFKPGVYLQLEAFLNLNTDRLIDVGNHIAISKMIYKKMLA